MRNAFYIQSPRLQIAFLLLISEPRFPHVGYLPVSTNHGWFPSCPWLGFRGEGQLVTRGRSSHRKRRHTTVELEMGEEPVLVE